MTACWRNSPVRSFPKMALKDETPELTARPGECKRGPRGSKTGRSSTPIAGSNARAVAGKLRAGHGETMSRT
jgi:hypothetical protein